MNSGKAKSKLRLVKNSRKIKQSKIYRPLRPKIVSAINRALKHAQENDWSDIIIIGSDNSVSHSPMRYKELIGLLEMNKHATIQEWLLED